MPVNPALLQHTQDSRKSSENRVAGQITQFAGSMTFDTSMRSGSARGSSCVEHYPFGLLTMDRIAGGDLPVDVVMISQNRADERRQVVADQRWVTVPDEEQRNEELLRRSNQISN